MTDDLWLIEKIVPGGSGMARLPSGAIGFAAGALPGERIRVQAMEHRKGHVVATAYEVVTPAAARVEPPCALASAGCGCDLMHATYDAQLAYKVDIVRDALERVGKLSALPAIHVEPCASQLGYRSRLRLHIDAGGAIGFHARGSHRLLPVVSCPVARPELDQALARFRRVAAEHRAQAAVFAEVELRVGPTARPSAWLSPRPGARGRGAAFLDALRVEFDVLVGDEPSDVAQRWPLTSEQTLRVPARAFVQVNWDVNRRLVAAVVAGAQSRSIATFVDLYAGVGNFGVALLAAGLTGTLVESHPEAAAAAEQTLREQSLSRGRVLRSDALALVRKLREPRPLDLVVLDPPRSGAAPLVPHLLRLGPRFLAYCACDPVTLARDLRGLVAGGYAVESVTAFDMFPGTHHVETLVWLARA